MSETQAEKEPELIPVSIALHLDESRIPFVSFDPPVAGIARMEVGQVAVVNVSRAGFVSLPHYPEESDNG